MLQGLAEGPEYLRRSYKPNPSRRCLEWLTIEGDSPVGEKERLLPVSLSTMGHVESRGKEGGPSPKAKYSYAIDSELVP